MGENKEEKIKLEEAEAKARAEAEMKAEAELKAKVNKINQEETIKLKLSETLHETTRLAGTLKINAMMYTDEKLANLLKEGSEALTTFNKGIAEFLSK